MKIKMYSIDVQFKPFIKEITYNKRSQRVLGAGNRIEKLLYKWTF